MYYGSIAITLLACAHGFHPVSIVKQRPTRGARGSQQSYSLPLEKNRPHRLVTARFSTSREKETDSYSGLNNETKILQSSSPSDTATDKETEDPLLPENLVKTADAIAQVTNGTTANEESLPTSRRMLFATGLFGVAAALGATSLSNNLNGGQEQRSQTSYSNLKWEVTPINKRTGVTVYDAEKSGYNIRFVTYLSRFLLSFDADCQRWWYSRAQDLPRLASAEEITRKRLQQFAAFSASVEVGLQEYEGSEGPAKLLQSLQQRYCPESLSSASLLSDAVREKQEREIKEARRQIALLFGLMEKNQPVQEISKLLAAIDNGHVGAVEVLDPGSGYAPGYGVPEVSFPLPEGGDGYEQATGRAVLKPNGRILRIDVVNRGAGYKSPPTVTVGPPAALRFQGANETDIIAEQAQAKAFLFRSGPNKGRIERIQLIKPGAGYTKSEIIKVRFSSPETTAADGGVTATATAVLEYQVDRIEMINNGTGYAVEKPIQVYIEPPPITARINMNDPLMARVVDPSKPLPATTIPSPEMLKKMPDPADFAQKLSVEASRAACIGRGCYDKPVLAVAYPVAEKDSYSKFRTEADTENAQNVERALNQRSKKANEPFEGRVVSGSTSGKDGRPPDLPSLGVASPISSSSQLLSLLPAGIGLEFDESQKRYVLAVDPMYGDDGAIKSWRTYKDFDPDFGPRGRTPIERDMDLGVATYLRFVASGAICCSVVHLALTPIDVVKTRVQTDPENNPSVIIAFKRVLREGGLSGFFTGWAPTFLGFFFWGGVAYSITEFLRRTFQAYAGDAAGSLEVPIILLAAGLAATVGSFVICPFEAVRIRSVAQQDYGGNILEVSRRMVQEEGVGTLFSAVPLFMAKEIPFAMVRYICLCDHRSSSSSLYLIDCHHRPSLQCLTLVLHGCTRLFQRLEKTCN